MIGIGVAASLIIRRERIRRVRLPVVIDVRETGLPAVCSGKPAEQMVKRPVLHRDHDHMLDSRSVGSWEYPTHVDPVEAAQRRTRCWAPRREGDGPRDQELAPPEHSVGVVHYNRRLSLRPSPLPTL